MGYQAIETGYKPEFGLGALYQGFNAANADQLSQEEVLKQFLANQREQKMQPLDVNVRDMESMRATMAKSPEMLDAYRRLYMGQADTTQAAGSKAMQTWKGEADLANATNGNDLTQQQFEARMNELRKNSIETTKGGDTSGGQIGFQMQPQQVEQRGVPGTIGFPAPSRPADGSSRSGSNVWIIPQQVQNTNDNAAGVLNVRGRSDPSYDLAELNRALASKNLKPEQRAALQGEKDRLTRGLASVSQAPNVNDSPVVTQAPQRNGGVTQGSPEYEALMLARSDSPKFRQELAKGDQKFDSAEFINERRIQAKFDESANRARTVAAKLPTMEQQMVQNILDRKAAGIISPAEATGELNAWLNRKYDKPLQQGVTAQVGEKGIEIVDKEKQTPTVRSKTGPTANRDALKEALSK